MSPYFECTACYFTKLTQTLLSHPCVALCVQTKSCVLNASGMLSVTFCDLIVIELELDCEFE